MSLSVSFFSNYLNEHQLPLCLAWHGMDDIEFTFVALTEKGGNAGRSNLNDDYSFVLREYESPECSKTAMLHAVEDDIVLFGHMCGKEQYVSQRMRNNRLSFRATERLLKRSLWWRFAPPKAWRTIQWFIRYRRKNMYILCTSAYASYDLYLSGWPSEKCFKWGYFPKALRNNTDTLSFRQNKTVSIVWAARLIQWKRPFDPLRLALDLKQAGYKFKLELVGDGPLMDDVISYIKENDLSDCVIIHGLISGDEVKRLMRLADIYITTSSRKEGWGITVNEAMAAECAVVASASIGSAPFLIRDGYNGLLYDDFADNDLLNKVVKLLDNPGYAKKLAARARDVVVGQWSAENAAIRLVCVGRSLLAEKYIVYEEGPCSKADIIKDGWYHTIARGVNNG